MSQLDLNNFDISKLDMNNFDMSQFNQLVNQASETIMCDADCQKERETNKLKERYLNAQNNLYDAPSKFETAEKNYYTFTVGKSGYGEIKEMELQATIEEITDDLKTEIDNKAAQIKTKIDTYNGLFLNLEKNVR